jgi:hypothetical protein
VEVNCNLIQITDQFVEFGPIPEEKVANFDGLLNSVTALLDQTGGTTGFRDDFLWCFHVYSGKVPPAIPPPELAEGQTGQP